MKAGMTKNSAGIGGKVEDLPCLGSFAESTGGTLVQRRLERNYSKIAHKEATYVDPLAVDTGPDISKPHRIF
jgi:hypothetical protein